MTNPTDPAKAAEAEIERQQRQAREDEARAKTTAARDEYTRNADGGRYRPHDPVTDLGE